MNRRPDNQRCFAVTCALLTAATLAPFGCASFRPIIASAPEVPEPAPRVESSSRASVAFESARPNGLLLTLSYKEDATDPKFDTLELWRAVDDEDARVMTTTALDEGLRVALTAGIPVLDRDLREGHTYAYQLVLTTSGEAPEMLSSSVATHKWSAAPRAPAETGARALTPNAIELTWTHHPEMGAIIFRRDLTRDGAKLEELTQLPPQAGNSFVDQTCEPTGLYAYRIAYVRDAEAAPSAFGHLSAMTYAATPPRHD